MSLYSKYEAEANAGKLVAFALLFPLLIMWAGVVFSWLWLWFAVPALNLPVITWWQASGLCVLLMWLKIGTTSTSKEIDDACDFVDGFSSVANRMFQGSLIHFGALVIGYVFHMIG